MNEELWKDLFTDIVKYTILPHENVDDVVAGGFVLGQRRAELLDRPFSPGEDVAHVLSIFCWWPFKPAFTEDSIQYLQTNRWNFFQAVSSSNNAINRLREVVTSEILTMNTQELCNTLRIRPAWEVLKLPVPPVLRNELPQHTKAQ